MNEYELLIEYINPCGGEKHAVKEFKEIEAESPEKYLEQNGQYPILDRSEVGGDVIITTGDGKGRIVRYTFSL